MHDQSTQTIEQALTVLCEAYQPQARAMASATGRREESCLVSLLRPLIRARLYGDEDSLHSAINGVDMRTRTWCVSVKFWDITHGHARADVLAQSDGDTVKGMPAVAELIREYADQVHESAGVSVDELPEFGVDKLIRRLNGMRPAISRNRGQASGRFYYELPTGLYMCTLLLERA